MIPVFDDLSDPIETEPDVLKLMVQELSITEHHIEVLRLSMKKRFELAFDVKLGQRDTVIVDVFDGAVGPSLAVVDLTKMGETVRVGALVHIVQGQTTIQEG